MVQIYTKQTQIVAKCKRPQTNPTDLTVRPTRYRPTTNAKQIGPAVLPSPRLRPGPLHPVHRRSEGARPSRAPATPSRTTTPNASLRSAKSSVARAPLSAALRGGPGGRVGGCHAPRVCSCGVVPPAVPGRGLDVSRCWAPPPRAGRCLAFPSVAPPAPGSRSTTSLGFVARAPLWPKIVLAGCGDFLTARGGPGAGGASAKKMLMRRALLINIFFAPPPSKARRKNDSDSYPGRGPGATLRAARSAFPPVRTRGPTPSS